jgi:hypothetical protein
MNKSYTIWPGISPRCNFSLEERRGGGRREGREGEERRGEGKRGEERRERPMIIIESNILDEACERMGQGRND